MSDDLVERLRSTAIGATLYSTEISDLLNEAAKAIERLTPPEHHLVFYVPEEAVLNCQGGYPEMYHRLAVELLRSIEATYDQRLHADQ